MDKRKEAYLWEKEDGEGLQCRLCNFYCRIADGKSGSCGVRKNIDGVLYSLNYNKLCAAGADPIEKKPLYHFLPGSSSYSIAAPGCNFRCVFCQNWQISQSGCNRLESCMDTTSEKVVNAAVKGGCKSISYTYTEPTVFMETAADVAVKAKEKGLKNIFVTNGYMSKEALEFAADWLDAVNVDLKAFSEKFYREMSGAKLQPVIDTIRRIKRDTNIHLELTTLLVPEMNDSSEELNDLAKFISEEISPETPWHISAFFPSYKFHKDPTNPELIFKACEIGKSYGLKYVYAGNIQAKTDTYCPECGELVIKRTGFGAKPLITEAICPKCKAKLPVIMD